MRSGRLAVVATLLATLALLGLAVPGVAAVETLERGYRLDGQVLRPARVVVSA